MIVASYDVESSGLDVNKDHVIEVGITLYSTGQKKCLASHGFLVKTDLAISAEITKLTGITKQATEKFGQHPQEAFINTSRLMQEADAIIGHNVIRFDKRITESWANRVSSEMPNKLWIDTYTDLPDTEPKKLILLAAEKGFLNMFPHSALSDTMTVVKILESYDIDRVVERAKSPTVVVQAHQNRYQNDLAKKSKFRWLPEKKLWWRFVKEMDLENFAKDLQFDISVHRENIDEFQDY